MYSLETYVVRQSECRKKERDGFRFVLVNVFALDCVEYRCHVMKMSGSSSGTVFAGCVFKNCRISFVRK